MKVFEVLDFQFPHCGVLSQCYAA